MKCYRTHKLMYVSTYNYSMYIHGSHLLVWCQHGVYGLSD